jgi:chromosome partitioning related protein ParA
MSYVISVMASKGGVGKTTLVANLSAVLADLGYRVLMIDADVQSSLSKYYPLASSGTKGLVELIMSKTVTEEMVSTTIFPNLYLVQSNDANGELQSMLANKVDRALRIRTALNIPFIHENFDFCVLDTQGALGHLQDAAAFASDLILTPLSPDALSAREFLIGTEKLIEQLSDGAAMQLSLPQIKSVINKMDRTKNAKEIITTVKGSFLKLRGLVTMIDPVVHSAKAYTEAMTLRIPVHCHEIQHSGKQESAYLAMHKLVWELFPSTHEMFGTCFGNLPPSAIQAIEKTFAQGDK